MAVLAVLCDVVGRYGGTERYWETVLPELARSHEVRLFARDVQEATRFGVRAQRIAWSNEYEEPSRLAAEQLVQSLAGADAAITANVFDPLALAAVRAAVPWWVARVHDYRPFCPNGNKVFPQFSGVCRLKMGSACVANSVLRGCVRGPRMESLRRVRARLRVRNRLHQADRVLVSSGYVRDECIKNGVNSARLRVTPPPLPEAAFSDTAQDPASGAVLFSGRFNDQKGLGSLIRALGRIERRLRPPLVIAGDGDERERREGAIAAERLGVEVSFQGWQPPEQVRIAIDRSRIVALPSLWPEPFGLSGIEAQARGRPVVAYDVGGVREWMNGGGIAVPRADEGAFARAIQQLTTDAALWERYSRSARSGAERYRLGAHVRAMEANLAGAGGRGADE